LITGIVLLVKNFDKVKAAMNRVWEVIENNNFLKFLILPIYLVVKAIKFLVKNWDKIKEAIMSVWEPIKKFFGFVIDGFNKIRDGIKSIFGGEDTKVTAAVTKEIKVSSEVADLPVKGNVLPDVWGWNWSGKSTNEDIIKKTDTKIVDALDKNTTAVAANTTFEKGKWKGRFTTSILKNANISDRMATNSIAKSAIKSEENIINTQKNTLNNTNLVTEKNIFNKRSESGNGIISGNRPQRNDRSQKQVININVVNRSTGEIGIEVDNNTGIEVTTTGNA